MKKILRLLLLLSLCIAMVGCSKKEIKSVNNEDDSSDSTVTQSEETTEEPEVTLAPTEAPLETVETAETEESTSGTKPSIGSLSDDIYSFQVELDGDIYQFPMTFDDLIAYGWEYDGDATQTMDPDQYTVGESFKKGDITIYAEIINLGANVEPFNKCSVAGFSIDDYLVGDLDISIILPGGIQFGKSTKKEIIAAYGEPTSTYDSDLYTTLTY